MEERGLERARRWRKVERRSAGLEGGLSVGRRLWLWAWLEARKTSLAPVEAAVVWWCWSVGGFVVTRTRVYVKRDGYGRNEILVTRGSGDIYTRSEVAPHGD